MAALVRTEGDTDFFIFFIIGEHADILVSISNNSCKIFYYLQCFKAVAHFSNKLYRL